jgi:hypothetical protein
MNPHHTGDNMIQRDLAETLEKLAITTRDSRRHQILRDARAEMATDNPIEGILVSILTLPVPKCMKSRGHVDICGIRVDTHNEWSGVC